MRGAKTALTMGAGLALLLGSLSILSAQNKNSTLKPPAAKPAANAPAPDAPASAAQVDTGGWSGQAGSSGDPLMTPAAIRAAAADFKKCLESLWPEAQLRGVSRAVFDASTAKLTPDLQIMDLLDSQPEYGKPIWGYIDTFVTADRIAQGKALLDQNQETFDAVEKAYGVDRYVIAAIWGVETNFGKQVDSRPVLRSTATLACVGRRQGYYREEFVSALGILNGGDVTSDGFKGNWAGAFGGTQFMPTAFRQFAIDFDKDGKRDVYGSVPDLIASTANYLRYNGWYPNRPWGYEVRLPENFNYLLSNGPRRSIRRWSEVGVTLVDGTPLPEDGPTSYVILPAGADGPAFLVFNNFNVLLTYNPAEAYALVVGYLSDRLRGQGPLVKQWPRGESALTTAERLELQQRLQQRGLFTVRAPNGMIDRATRAAIQKFQVAVGLTPDGFATAAVLDRLRMQ
jgi:membrane-bound lytic murein transglycosylase B